MVHWVTCLCGSSEFTSTLCGDHRQLEWPRYDDDFLEKPARLSTRAGDGCEDFLQMASDGMVERCRKPELIMA